MESHTNIKINLIPIDDQGDPAIAQKVAPTASQNLDILGIVGPAYSGATLASMPSYKAAGIPVISPTASNPQLTDPSSTMFAGNLFHRIVSFGSKEGYAISTLALKNVASPKVFMIDIKGDSYINTLAKDTMFWLNNVSRDILVGYQAINYDGTSNSTAIDTVKNSGANVIIFSGCGYVGSNLLKQIREAKIKAIFVGGTCLYSDPEFKFKNEDALDGLRVVGLPSLKLISPAIAADFTKQTGSEPGTYSIATIDATNIFLNGFADGATTRTSMNDYIAKYKGVGLQGIEISFDIFGDLKANNFVGYEYINKQFQQLIKAY